MLINSLYGLSAPSQRIQRDRKKRVAEVIKQMGDKYLLAIRIQRKDAK